MSAIAALWTVVARADPVLFPRFDIETTCHELANYAFAATLGQSDTDKELALCSEREREMRDLALAAWARNAVRERTECVALAERKYSALARCLDPSIPGRTIR